MDSAWFLIARNPWVIFKEVLFSIQAYFQDFRVQWTRVYPEIGSPEKSRSGRKYQGTDFRNVIYTHQSGNPNSGSGNSFWEKNVFFIVIFPRYSGKKICHITEFMCDRKTFLENHMDINIISPVRHQSKKLKIKLTSYLIKAMFRISMKISIHILSHLRIKSSVNILITTM